MRVTDRLYAYIWRNMQANNCNTFIVRTPEATCLIDPGHRAFLPRLLRSMQEDGIPPEQVRLVILTHGHPDHLEGGLELRKTGAHLAIHRAEEQYLKEVGPYFARIFGLQMPDLSFDLYLEEGDVLIGEERLQVIHTPGHSPGSVCLYWHGPGVLFSGDLVFAQGVGRTDFPGGDSELLKESIRKCRSLRPQMLMPGHGEAITSQAAVEQNFDLIERMYFDYL
ncbi:MAG: MBL fold metallo-hydrolase [bacterium]